jgi:YesN/AraC family two-component response regulator
MRKSSAHNREKLRAVIADDSDHVRQGLARLVAAFARLELVGAAEDGLEALATIERLDPDLIILDMRMPGMTGLEVLRALGHGRPKRVIIVLSALADESCKQACLQSGAHHFFDKITEFGKFIDLLKTL